MRNTGPTKKQLTIINYRKLIPDFSKCSSSKISCHVTRLERYYTLTLSSKCLFYYFTTGFGLLAALTRTLPASFFALVRLLTFGKPGPGGGFGKADVDLLAAEPRAPTAGFGFEAAEILTLPPRSLAALTDL